MTRKRWLGLLVAALLVPLPAFALSAGSSAAALDVSVSNAGCGIGGGSSIVCRLQVSFNPIDGASSYTASITAPDGSVVDYGAIGPGGTTIPVPYTGDGTYSVSVSAWGKETNRHHHDKPLATDSTGRVRNATATVQDAAGTRGGDVAPRHAHGTVSTSDATRNADGGGHASATVDSSSSSTDSHQTCTPPPPPPPPPTTTTTPTTTTPSTTTTPTTTTTTTPPPSSPPPPSSNC